MDNTSGVLLFFLFFFGAIPANAQTATLSGFITDRSNGEALELVNVILRNEAGIARGSSTNRDGLYLIPRINPGVYELVVSFIGFETYTDTLELAPGESRTINISLVVDETQLDEVTIETERSGGAARVIAGQQTVRPADLEYVPTPDVSGDLASYLALQPGIVSTGDRGGQFFIRGGEPSQNLVQIDGILLYQPFHLLGFYSAFPSEILSRADVYAGGFGSKFGGRISSVIDITTRNGNNRRFAGSASMSPFISALQVEGPLIPNRISLLVSGRQSTVEEVASRYIEDNLPFNFNDIFAKVHGVVSDNSRISISGLRTYDRGTLGQERFGEAPEEIRWQNDALGARYLLLPQVLSIMADFHVSFSRLQTELGPKGNLERYSFIENTFVSLEATYLGDRVDVEAGTSLRLNRIESQIGGLYQNLALRKTRISNWGNYFELEYDFGNGFRIRPGLRAEFYAVRFDPYLEPRLRLIWEKGVHQISGSAGLYNQEIIGVTDRRDAASIFTVWTNIPRINPNVEDVRQGRIQRAVHSILGYRTSPAPWLDLSIEAFYKDLTNLFIAEWTSFPRFTTRLQPAQGRVLGFDTRIELRRGTFYGYINYGLSSTEYDAEQEAVRYWYGEESLRFRPGHDRRHQVNVLASVRLMGINANIRWEFGSGLPFSQAVGFDGFSLISDIEKTIEIPSSRRVIYERPFNAVLPTYHRLDFSLERSFTFDRTTLTVQGSLINAYDRRNLFYLDIYTLRRADQIPIIPSIGLKLEVQ